MKQKQWFLGAAVLAGAMVCAVPGFAQDAKATSVVESDVVALPPPMQDSDVIATVGTASLTWGELNTRANELIQALGAGRQIPEKDMENLKQRLRRNLVQEFLEMAAFKQIAAAKGIVLDNDFRKQCVETLEKSEGQPISELLKASPFGEARTMEILEAQFLAEKVMQEEVISKIVISEDEVNAEVEKAKSLAKLVDDEMAGYLAQVKAGTATFESLVAANSQIKMTLPVPEESLAREFPANIATVIKATPVGGLTPVLDLGGAKAIFEVVSRDAATTGGDAEAKAKAEELLAKIKAGEDFATLAKEYSDCPSGQRGGDLGDFGKGQMVPEFEAASFAQPIGEVGELVKTTFGYHIIKVTARDEAKGTVRASHILIKSEAKPATVTLRVLLKPAPEVLTAAQVRELLKAQRERQETSEYFVKQLEKLGVTSRLFPEFDVEKAK